MIGMPRLLAFGSTLLEKGPPRRASQRPDRPRYHHAITERKNGVDLINGFKFLDLGHHRSGVAVLADQASISSMSEGLRTKLRATQSTP